MLADPWPAPQPRGPLSAPRCPPNRSSTFEPVGAVYVSVTLTWSSVLGLDAAECVYPLTAVMVPPYRSNVWPASWWAEVTLLMPLPDGGSAVGSAGIAVMFGVAGGAATQVPAVSPRQGSALETV